MKMDVGLSDLRYKIPFGQTRNLLSSTARLTEEEVTKSFIDGSIRKRLDQGVLIEVESSVELKPPLLSVADPQNLSFTNRAKSAIVVEDSNVEDGIQSSILADDEELLKEMDMEFDQTSFGAPISVSDKDDPKTKD